MNPLFCIFALTFTRLSLMQPALFTQRRQEKRVCFDCYLHLSLDCHIFTFINTETGISLLLLCNLALCLPKADATASYGSETLSEVLSEMITTVKSMQQQVVEKQKDKWCYAWETYATTQQAMLFIGETLHQLPMQHMLVVISEPPGQTRRLRVTAKTNLPNPIAINELPLNAHKGVPELKLYTPDIVPHHCFETAINCFIEELKVLNHEFSFDSYKFKNQERLNRNAKVFSKFIRPENCTVCEEFQEKNVKDFLNAFARLLQQWYMAAR